VKDDRHNSLALDGRNIWSLLEGSSKSPHELLYIFNNEDIAAVRTQNWKYVVRAYHKKSYIAFDNIKKKMGFDYDLLFDMNAEMPERYSQAENYPNEVKDMMIKLTQGREMFDPMRSRPKPAVFP